MIGRGVLPPLGPTSGFWAATTRRGYNARAVWAAASAALTSVFHLRPTETRDLLDSDLGELLAGDLGFIEGNIHDAEAIEDLIRSRLDHLGWRRLYLQAIAAIRRADSGPATPTDDH